MIAAKLVEVLSRAGLSPSCILIVRAIRWQQLPCHQRPAHRTVQAWQKRCWRQAPALLPTVPGHQQPAPGPRGGPRGGHIIPGRGNRCGTAELGLQGETREGCETGDRHPEQQRRAQLGHQCDQTGPEDISREDDSLMESFCKGLL